MARSTLPLQSTDDGWPYPDGVDDAPGDDDVDLDVLELRADPHLWDSLTAVERDVVLHRFGLADGRARSMKQIAHELGLNHTETRNLLAGALDKIRHKLAALDDG